jgi:very-short-patch-repair endonuclease
MRFIADFYSHEARLIVEVDGKVHEDPHAIEHDAGRTYELSEENIMVIRFRNEEILGNLNDVLLQIHAEIQNRIFGSERPAHGLPHPPAPSPEGEGGGEDLQLNHQ